MTLFRRNISAQTFRSKGNRPHRLSLPVHGGESEIIGGRERPDDGSNGPIARIHLTDIISVPPVDLHLRGGPVRAGGRADGLAAGQACAAAASTRLGKFESHCLLRDGQRTGGMNGFVPTDDEIDTFIVARWCSRPRRAARGKPDTENQNGHC